MIQPKLINYLLILWFAFFTGFASALPSDREQPIHIASDTAEINDISGISVYRGKVNMVQGSIKLVADEVTIHRDKEGVSKLVAVGTPAHFEQLPEINKSVTHAFGSTIEYYVSEERLELKKQAKLEQNQNVFTGERIDYDMKQRLVNAYSDKKSTSSSANSSRVNLIIQPKNSSDTDTDKNSSNE